MTFTLCVAAAHVHQVCSPWIGNTGAGKSDISSQTSLTATFEAFSSHPLPRCCYHGSHSGLKNGGRHHTAAAAASTLYPCEHYKHFKKQKKQLVLIPSTIMKCHLADLLKLVCIYGCCQFSLLCALQKSSANTMIWLVSCQIQLKYLFDRDLGRQKSGILCSEKAADFGGLFVAYCIRPERPGLGQTQLLVNYQEKRDYYLEG